MCITKSLNSLKHILMKSNYISINKIVSYYFYIQRSLMHPYLSEMYAISDGSLPKLECGSAEAHRAVAQFIYKVFEECQ